MLDLKGYMEFNGSNTIISQGLKIQTVIQKPAKYLTFVFHFSAAGPKDTPMELVLEKTNDAKTGRGMPEL